VYPLLRTIPNILVISSVSAHYYIVFNIIFVTVNHKQLISRRIDVYKIKYPMCWKVFLKAETYMKLLFYSINKIN